MSSSRTSAQAYAIGRAAVLRSLLLWPVNRIVHRVGARHRREGAKPLAIFAFDHIGHRINLEGLYEGPELRAFVTWAARERAAIFDGCAVDIGANIGNHSLFFADHFRAVRSFEPHPRTYALLKLNAELADNVTCHGFGISDAAGVAYISDSAGNAGGATVSAAPAGGTRQIELQPLDAVLDPGERVTLIKLDVEGHEYPALLGCRETIARHRPLVLFEQHAQELVGGSSRVIDLLRSFGYGRFFVVEAVPGMVRFLPPLLAYPLTALLRLALGMSMVVREVTVFEPRFHPFVIAVPEPAGAMPTAAGGAVER